ncbi:MAG TPA: PCMD domain-containing protein [Chitinophagales bacterium]|nr:PCMD domain-containing protein [Chitinophagales bacterium]
MKRLYYLGLVLITTIAVFTACSKIKIEKPKLKNILMTCDSIRKGGVFVEIPNLDFEDWTPSSSKRYEEPSLTCFWATPSKANDIISAIPITVSKVTGDDAHSGKYGCKIQSQAWGALFTSGTVASGKFSPDFKNPLQSIQFGQPFNKKIKEVRGWYKFQSVKQDSCSFYCYQLKKVGSQVDTINFSRIVTNVSQPNWTEFVLTPVYRKDDEPNVLVLYFASSEAGSELKGQVGNTLIIDDISITYY